MDDVKPEIGQQQKTAGHSKRRYMLMAVVIMLGALIGAAVIRRDGQSGNAQAETPSVAHAADEIQATSDQLKQIRVEKVRERLVDLGLETTGKVGFNEDRLTPVFAPYAGRVLEVLANKGELVKSGQPLLVVESPDMVTAVNDLAAAHTEADKAKIALDIADKAAQRARRLNEQDALATKELQAAESDLARAHEDVRRALAAVTVARNRLSLVGKSEEEIAELEESTTNQVERKIVIRAPLAGTIVDRKVGPGQYIKPDSPDPQFLISDLSEVWVNADVYETYLPQIHVGAPVEITVTAYSDRKFPARIAAINPTVDPETRTVHVRCSVPNSAGLLKPEMFANIRIGGTGKQVPTIPPTAILTQGPDSFVLVETSAGQFRRRRVKAGRETQDFIEVEEGLGPDDRVVTSGALLLRNAFEGR